MPVPGAPCRRPSTIRRCRRSRRLWVSICASCPASTGARRTGARGVSPIPAPDRLGEALIRRPDQPHVRGDDVRRLNRRGRVSADQPHVRGDDCVTTRGTRSHCSDQPHVRGDDRCRLDRPRPRRRISPTRVGTTSKHHSYHDESRWISPPRVGTTSGACGYGCRACGSAPRVWGRLSPRTTSRRSFAEMTLRFSVLQLGQIWISPTCVGTITPGYDATTRTIGSAPRAWGRRTSTKSARRRGRVSADQPHVRGDDEGSPGEHRLLARISPTCVGTTCEVGARVRGGVGSAPRVWGRLSSCASTQTAATDQPHVCGDDVSRSSTTASSSDGSAPRAWGRPSYCTARSKLSDRSAPRVWGRRVPT